MQGPTSTNACPRCAHENTADQTFCGNCGLRIDGLCPVCGRQNEHSTHFCGTCGHDFTTADEPVAQDTRTTPASPRQGDLRGQVSPHPPETAPPPPPPGIDCPRCHHTNEPGARFCYNCGLPFDSAAGVEGMRAGRSIPAYVGAKPGGFWLRAVATIVDSIIVTAVISFILALFSDVSPRDYYFEPQVTVGGFVEALIWAVNLLYVPVLVSLWATTIGKRAFNMYLMRPDGSRVGFVRAFLRELAKIVSALPFFIGFLMVAFREDKRGLHDLIVDTVVVQR